MAKEQTIENILSEGETNLTEEIQKSKIEDLVLKYFHNAEIAKERREENKLLKEEIEQYYENMGTDEEIYVPLPSGEFMKIGKRIRIKEKLDKDSLAEHIQISKDELKTPWDFSMLTKQEKITPKMISDFTQTETDILTRISKAKNKPKNKKKKQ